MKLVYCTLILLISCNLSFAKNAERQIGTEDSGRVYHDKPNTEVLRILTYNVRNCSGMDGKTDYSRVADVITAIHPEAVALQELDSVTSRSNGSDVLKVLANKCLMNYIYGASIPYKGGKYGIGVLSREMPLKTSFVPLPGREEKRGLLIAEFLDYVLFCTHFSLTESDRLASVKIINLKVHEFQKPVILAGDFNASPSSNAINSLSGEWINLSGKKPTFPSNQPVECIDYVWGFSCCNQHIQVIKQEVVPEKMASDHRPVFVDIRLK